MPRPAAREVFGDTIWTMEKENHWQAALGTSGRSGLGQWDIWQAVFGPQGPDGYPAAIWDKLSGEIDHSVAQGWQGMDIRLYLESNWPNLGPKLTDRVHIFTGDDDTFFLNDAVELLEGAVADLNNPSANFEFQYGHNQPHCWRPLHQPGAAHDHVQRDDGLDAFGAGLRRRFGSGGNHSALGEPRVRRARQ